MNLRLLSILVAAISSTMLRPFTAPAADAKVLECDICVFGGTSAGVAAAVQASRMGKTAIVVEPSKYIGGLTTGGLGATDIGNKAAIGGVSREFYHRVAQYYSQDSAWTLETRDDYFKRRGSGQTKVSSLSGPDATMWTFEPHVADRIFQDMLKETHVQVFNEQRLASVKKTGARIAEIVMENGNVFRAKMFIDATYEGDLMAKAGVSYVVGREANAIYDETLNGIRAKTPSHQFIVAVDPYMKKGDPASGLIPFVQNVEFGTPGAGDKTIQAYNYRLCLTKNSENSHPIDPPPGYKPEQYELLARYLEALTPTGIEPAKPFWGPVGMPNLKTDTNNKGGFSTDFIGMNYDYPEAGYAEREKIARAHEDYIRGYITFLKTSPRVPETLREEAKKWGLCKDEFADTGGWPHALYVREARRMVSDLVMTEHYCRGKEVAQDPVGLAAYTMDSHNCRRLVRDGRVENEGDTQAGGFPPYPISYRSIIPRTGECENLAVPVCLSASHIAYGSIRMEPVFMILGQSAATAAVLSMNDKVSLQELDYTKLKAQLLKDGQILAWDKSKTTPTPAVETPAPAVP